MNNEWEVAKTTGRCAVTGRTFAEGESYYAVLVQGTNGLERRDYALDAWTGPPPEGVSYWRARVPVREKKKSAAVVDHALLTHLFLRLEDQTAEMTEEFRFVLALLLMRKRLLKFEGTVNEEGREYWQMRLVAQQSVHQVLNPQLSNEQIDRLGAQLVAILGGEVEAITSIEDGRPASPATAEENLVPDGAGGVTASDTAH